MKHGAPSLRGSRVVLALTSVIASGTERRMSFVYRHLVRRAPDRYALLLTPDLFAVLNRGGYGLDRLPHVHLLGPRSPLDRKLGAHAPLWVNLGRMFTLNKVRREIRALVDRGGVSMVHLYLEMVPYHAVVPLKGIPIIAAVVDHLPKYFDSRTLDCRLLLRAIRHSVKADCLYPPQARWLRELGVELRKLNNSKANCVNHEAFHPEAKVQAVTFASRAIDWKNPDLMLDVAERVLRREPDTLIYILGQGPLESSISREIAARGLERRVISRYMEDPSPVINRSRIHVSLDRYDNAPNQSMLEGMAAGCAIVASDVGETRQVVTPDVGQLAEFSAEAIAESILGLLGDRQRAEAMGRAARDKVLKDHHVDDYVDYLLALHDLSRAEPIVNGRVGNGVPGGPVWTRRPKRRTRGTKPRSDVQS